MSTLRSCLLQSLWQRSWLLQHSRSVPGSCSSACSDQHLFASRTAVLYAWNSSSVCLEQFSRDPIQSPHSGRLLQSAIYACCDDFLVPETSVLCARTAVCPEVHSGPRPRTPTQNKSSVRLEESVRRDGNYARLRSEAAFACVWSSFSVRGNDLVDVPNETT